MRIDHAEIHRLSCDLAYERFRLWQLIHKLKQRYHGRQDMDFTPFDQVIQTATKIADLSHQIQAGVPAAVAAGVSQQEAADTATLATKIQALQTPLGDALNTLTAVAGTLPAPNPPPTPSAQ